MSEKLKIIPLGGLGEIGKNMTVIEYGDDIMIVDCGVAFPDEEMLGIDLVIPDITYLEKNREKVRAIVLTHGHEDHIGAIPYFLRKINVPIYGTTMTLGILGPKLAEHKLLNSAEMITVSPGDFFELGVLRRGTHSYQPFRSRLRRHRRFHPARQHHHHRRL